MYGTKLQYTSKLLKDCDSTFPCILGLDFLPQSGVQIHFGELRSVGSVSHVSLYLANPLLQIMENTRQMIP